MRDEVGAEILEAQLGGAHQIADEGQGIAQDAAQRSPGALDVAQRAGTDHVEDNLEQVPRGLGAPADEAPGKAAENAGQLEEGARHQDDVDQLQRAESLQEQAGNLVDEAAQRAEGAPEPGEGAGNRIGLLHIGPDLFFADELHEFAQQADRVLGYRFAGDRIAPHDGAQQGVAARVAGKGADRAQDGVLDQVDDAVLEGCGKRQNPADGARDDGPGAVPQRSGIAQLEHRKAADEVLDVLPQRGADVAQRLELFKRPAAHLVEHSVVVQRFGHQAAARDHLDGAAQDVAGAPVDPRIGDRVKTDDDREHCKAGNGCRSCGKVFARVGDAEEVALYLQA